MTTLNPTHIPSSSDNPSRGQAIYKRDVADDTEEFDESGYPKSVKKLERDARREARQRIKRVQPTIPDLRFEQSYLLSIRPFLHPRSAPGQTASVTESSKASNVAGGSDSKTLTTSSDQDEVFSWGRDIDVDYKNLFWVTFRDQLVSPLVQGFFWGVLTVSISTFSQVGRTALYPASHKSKGRLTGGAGSDLNAAGSGEAEKQADRFPEQARFTLGVHHDGQSLLDIVNIVYPAPHSSTTSPPTTMPALKTKTNLPKSNEDPSSLVDASEKKKKPYARKAPVNTDKQIIKKPKAKAQAKRGNAFPASDPPRGEGASTRRVEVVIDRVMEEEEVAPVVDDEEHIDHGQTVGGHPLRHTKVVAPSMQGVEANFVSQNDEAEFWKGDDQETMSDLIDDLLKRDDGDVGKGVQTDTNIKHQNQIGGVAAHQRAPETDKQQHKLGNITKPDGLILAQPSVSGTKFAAPSPRTPPKLAKGEEEDLIHSVVIKVIEHALSKNVDWHQMATEGFPNRKAAQPVKAKGKGKGKKAEHVDGEGESSEPRKTRGKVDGNYLYELFHYNILPALKDKKVPWKTGNDA